MSKPVEARRPGAGRPLARSDMARKKSSTLYDGRVLSELTVVREKINQWWSGLWDEPLLNRELDKIRVGFQVKLVHNAVFVKSDGARGDLH